MKKTLIPCLLMLGLDKAGYNYICLDDFWHAGGAANTDEAANATLNLPDYYLVAGKKYYVRDLWAHNYVETSGDGFTTNVASHETKVFRVSENELTGNCNPATKVKF